MIVIDVVFVMGMPVQGVEEGADSSGLASGIWFGFEIPGHCDTELRVIVNSAGDKKPAMKILVNQPGILLHHIDRLH